MTPQPQWGPASKGREGRGDGLLLRGTEGRVRRRERMEKEGRGLGRGKGDELAYPNVKL